MIRRFTAAVTGTAEVAGTGLDPMPYIVMYHSVDEYTEDPFAVTVRPARFARQLEWFRRRGLRGVSADELFRARAEGRADGLVGLTFDDGYADFATQVVPVLRRYGFTATVFVLAGRLGGDNGWETHGPVKRLMTAEQVREVADAGMEIGSHGMRHLSLPSVESAADALTEEIAGSRAALRELTGREIAGFCYPYGHVGAREVAAVRAAGYDYGCAIWPSELTARHAVARTYIGDRDGSLRLSAKRLRHELTWRSRVR